MEWTDDRTPPRLESTGSPWAPELTAELNFLEWDIIKAHILCPSTCTVLRGLASEHNTHPDYQQEWTP